MAPWWNFWSIISFLDDLTVSPSLLLYEIMQKASVSLRQIFRHIIVFSVNAWRRKWKIRINSMYVFSCLCGLNFELSVYIFVWDCTFMGILFGFFAIQHHICNLNTIGKIFVHFHSFFTIFYFNLFNLGCLCKWEWWAPFLKRRSQIPLWPFNHF